MRDDILDNLASFDLELGDLIALRHLDGALEYARFVAGYEDRVLVTRHDLSECFFPVDMIAVAATVAALEA